MSTLFVAAGGGGDAVAILLARRLLAPDEDGPVAIATCAWERLIIDPVPGPRSPNGFVGLADHIGVSEILATSDTSPASRSMLPRLVAECAARVFLLDMSGGVRGMASQLIASAQAVKADRIVVVDSGGDAIASGDELGLLSPLADAMAVASALTSGLPTDLAVLGPGTDGEVVEGEVLSRLNEVGAKHVGHIGPEDVTSLGGVLRWHPTEASGIVAAAALGERPRVAMRRGGSPFAVSDHTAGVWTVSPVLERLPLAALVADTRGLDEAARLMADRATDELAYERAKAAALSTGGCSRGAPELQLRADATAGATHVTLRRAWEITGARDPRGSWGSVRLEASRSGLLTLRVFEQVF